MTNNQKTGSEFEKMVVQEFEKHAPALTVNHIDRSSSLRYESTFDIELVDFPNLKLDCKFTIGQFSFNDMRKLLAVCRNKYCQNGGVPVIVFGERRGKTKITRDNIGVAMESNVYGLVVLSLKDWLSYLNKKVIGDGVSLPQNSIPGD